MTTEDDDLVDAMHDAVTLRERMRVERDAYRVELTAQREEVRRLADEVARLRAALTAIAEHPHCTDADRCHADLDDGEVDEMSANEVLALGHRCAAVIARDALDHKGDDHG